MFEIPSFFYTGGGLLVALIIVIWAILWFFVPFYIFSINKKIKILLNYYLQKDGKKISWWDGNITSIKPSP